MRLLYKFLSTLLFIAAIVVTSSCDSEDGSDCTQAAGEIINQEVSVTDFSQIIVYERVKLQLIDGADFKVELSTGENLVNDIDITVEDEVLIIRNNNSCNLVRDYGITVVTVTAPELKSIRSSTGEDVVSLNTLSYDNLDLISEDFEEEDIFHTTGDFRLDLDLNSLTIITNNLSNFYLQGSTTQATISQFSGDGRIIAQDLEISRAQILHRGTNSWQLDIKDEIRGVINGYGDVIIDTRPAIVDVDVTWRGELLFLD